MGRVVKGGRRAEKRRPGEEGGAGGERRKDEQIDSRRGWFPFALFARSPCVCACVSPSPHLLPCRRYMLFASVECSKAQEKKETEKRDEGGGGGLGELLENEEHKTKPN